jgi:hypothetical protein
MIGRWKAGTVKKNRGNNRKKLEEALGELQKNMHLPSWDRIWYMVGMQMKLGGNVTGVEWYAEVMVL